MASSSATLPHQIWPHVQPPHHLSPYRSEQLRNDLPHWKFRPVRLVRGCVCVGGWSCCIQRNWSGGGRPLKLLPLHHLLLRHHPALTLLQLTHSLRAHEADSHLSHSRQWLRLRHRPQLRVPRIQSRRMKAIRSWVRQKCRSRFLPIHSLLQCILATAAFLLPNRRPQGRSHLTCAHLNLRPPFMWSIRRAGTHSPNSKASAYPLSLLHASNPSGAGFRPLSPSLYPSTLLHASFTSHPKETGLRLLTSPPSSSLMHNEHHLPCLPRPLQTSFFFPGCPASFGPPERKNGLRPFPLAFPLFGSTFPLLHLTFSPPRLTLKYLPLTPFTSSEVYCPS